MVRQSNISRCCIVFCDSVYCVFIYSAILPADSACYQLFTMTDNTSKHPYKWPLHFRYFYFQGTDYRQETARSKDICYLKILVDAIGYFQNKFPPAIIYLRKNLSVGMFLSQRCPAVPRKGGSELWEENFFIQLTLGILRLCCAVQRVLKMLFKI